jgi:hypothetical protein
MSHLARWILALSLPVAAVASVPIRTTMCQRGFDAVALGIPESAAVANLGRMYESAKPTEHWLHSELEYTCHVWPVPKVWAVGISSGLVSEKELLVSP